MTIDWDHAWMEANWKSTADEDIAKRFSTTVANVKGYRGRKGWKREAQRQRGGNNSPQRIEDAIREAIASGTTIRLSSYRMGDSEHIVLTACQGERKTHPYILHRLSLMPRVLKEATAELNAKVA